MPSIFRHNCRNCLTICNMLRQTLQILNQKSVSWSYSLERTPEAEFLVSQLFPVSLVCVIDKCLLYGKCRFSTTRRQLMPKQFPFSNHFCQFLYQILQTGVTVSIAVLNFVTVSVVISVTVLVVIKRGDHLPGITVFKISVMISFLV